MHQLEGPLPADVFAYEPDSDHPIPTQVKYSVDRTHGNIPTDDVLTQELDEQGRLLSVRSEIEGVMLTREWTGEETFVDTLANGSQRKVNGSEGGYIDIDEIDGSRTTLWRGHKPGEEDITLIARNGDHNPVHIAKLSQGGVVLLEKEYDPDSYEFSLSPDYTSVWDYDDEANLVAVRQRYGDGNKGRLYFEQRVARTGSTALSVVGVYYPGGEDHEELVAQKQEREYDDEGRVIAITSQISVPTSATRQYSIELSYD